MCQIIVNGKRCQILKDTLDLSVPVNTALVDLQLKRKDSASSLCYYARHFCGYLLGKGITDLADVTAADLRFFAEELVSAGKSAAVVNAYASLIGEIFNAFIELNGHPHSTLLKGDAAFAAGGRGTKRRNNFTLAATIIRRKVSKKERRQKTAMITYTKWYTPEEVQLVAQTLSLRDRCIFLLSIETGYRISSVLSIFATTENIKNGFVEETFSKTGPTHAARISPTLQRYLAEYMATARRRVVEKIDKDNEYLFLTSKGKNAGTPVSYNAFYIALKSAEKKIHEAHPDKQDMVLHTHAGRSTFFNRLMHENLDRKQRGENPLSDAQICHLMDWSSMDCLEAYYDFQERALPPTPLYEDFLQN